MGGLQTTVREDAPDLSFEGERVKPDWLFDFLKQPHTIRPGLRARMPDFRLTDEEALALTEFLGTLRERDAQPLPESMKYSGTISREYREAARLLTSKDYLDCFKCHVLGDKTPGGKPQEWAPDLIKAATRLNPDWIIRWIQDPPKYQPGTRMPVFFPDKDSGPEDILEGDEQQQIAALRGYIMSLGDGGRSSQAYRAAKESYPEVTAAMGRSLMVKLNCVGCHNVATLPDGKRVGPSLAHEGSRVQRAWLLGFLRNPTVITPGYDLLGLEARMPNFRLSEAESKALADYFEQHLVDTTLSKDPVGDPEATGQLAEQGERLFEEKECRSCHRIGSKAGGIGPVLTGARDKLKRGWVHAFIRNPQHFLPTTNMPNLKLTEEEARAVGAFLVAP
jgi:mono/diheme cytochrome c family protein